MSFGAIADDYDRLRPTAPREAIDWLLPERREVVVDLGAGTGLLTRAVAGNAGHVIAVEPDERMRAVLAARSPGVEVLAGRGEQIPLPDASADVVLVSSAWHWLDPGLAVPEIARILRDGARLGVIWTGRDRSVEWIRLLEWFREPGELPGASRPDRDRDQAGDRVVRLPAGAPFANIETATFQFTRSMAVSDVIDVLATHSRVITAGAEARAAGLARAEAALRARFPGADEMQVPMRSRGWRADRVRRNSG
jgi:SAM-dependent methyltransferase